MSLKAFHLFFVTMCIIVVTWFGAWCLQNAGSDGATRLMGVAALGASAGLVAYLFWIAKKLRNVGMLVIAAGFLFHPSISEACAVCFGDPKSPLVQSANTAILFLLGVISSVLVAFATLFLSWCRRAYQLGLKP